MPKRKLWTRNESILAIDLYCRTVFGKIDARNKDIIALAKQIGRTPNSVALKLTNFASLDPTLDRVGVKNVSKLDRKMWSEFFDDPDAFFTMASRLTEAYPTPENNYGNTPGFREGGEYEVTRKARKNQDYFRQMVLASNRNSCCITGIEIPEVLIASHIILWAEEPRYRTDPTNGLCLNALHDKAFDQGLIVLDDEYRVNVSSKLKKCRYSIFNDYEGKQIHMPDRFLPSREFLKKHRDEHKDLY